MPRKEYCEAEFFKIFPLCISSYFNNLLTLFMTVFSYSLVRKLGWYEKTVGIPSISRLTTLFFQFDLHNSLYASFNSCSSDTQYQPKNTNKVGFSISISFFSILQSSECRLFRSFCEIQNLFESILSRCILSIFVHATDVFFFQINYSSESSPERGIIDAVAVLSLV